jgi:hypothetical protein
MMLLPGHITCIEKARNAYTILIGEPERKKPLGRSSLRWNGIKKNRKHLDLDRD